MTEEESLRARDVGPMYAVLPAIDTPHDLELAYADVARGPARRLPVGRRRAPPGGRGGGGPAGRHRRPGAVRVVVTGAAGFIGRWVVGELLDARPRGPPRRQPEPGRPRQPRRVRGPSRASSRSSWGTCATGRRAAHGSRAPTPSPTWRRPSPSRTASTSRPRRSTTTWSGRSGSWRRPARHGTRVLFMSTCMVYDLATAPEGIAEDHPVKPASPYAASKIAGEALTLGYDHAYGLPATVVRPFNTYGPFQRSVGEGGVVAIFTRRSLLGEELRIYGDGTQTRDLLYAGDCARFVCDALFSDAATGRVLNAGTGCRRVRERAGRARRAGPGADRPRAAHPSPERDRRAPLRCAPRRPSSSAGGRRSRCPTGWPRPGPGWPSASPPGSASRDGPARHRRRHARPGVDAAVRPAGHLGRRRRGRGRGPPLGLAHDRAPGAGLRGGPRGRDGRPPRDRLQQRDRGPPRRDGLPGPRPRATRWSRRR